MKKENTARKITLAFVISVLIILAWYLTTTYNDIPTGILPTIPMVGQALERDPKKLILYWRHSSRFW